MALAQDRPPAGRYPEGAAASGQVAGRQRRGTLWATVFLASTAVGIIALAALLYNVINSAFGFVAVQNAIDPDTIVRQHEETQLLALPGLVSGEDDDVLAAAVAQDPNAIGFFGFAYYQRYADTLRLVAVDGVVPDADTVNDGTYPLARPLYIYTDAESLRGKPAVAAFTYHYLTHVGDVIADVGYFPSNEIADDLAEWTAAVGAATPPVAEDGAIRIVGSSTVYPLTRRVTDDFLAAGFGGDIQVENIGTKAGFATFCTDPTVDIQNASRAILRAELEACTKARRAPLEFRVGNDALAIVVNRENTWLESVTQAQLQQIYGGAQTWAEVDPDWPNTPIHHVAPGADSGTLDYFVESVMAGDLSDLSKADLTEILAANVSTGLMRRFENDKPFAERSQHDVYELVLERVVNPEIIQSWSLSDSLTRRDEIAAVVATIPNGELTFRSWVTADFVTSPQSSRPEFAGIRTAILGSLWTILVTILFALPLGVGAAVYLEEYARNNWFNRLIETNINNLAGVPSIIYGMLGLALFVRTLEIFTSGKLFGLVDPTTANGRTVMSASLTLGLLILPLIIINAREAIRAVPRSLREASYGLGATQWQTVWSHVLPNAIPGILTGTILAISRAIGETAPLVVIGASTFILVDPEGPFSKFTTLPIQIYQWTSRPQDEFRNLAAAAIIVLLVMLLSLNATAVILRNRFSRQRI